MGLLSRAESIIAEKRRKEQQPLVMSADSMRNVEEDKLSQYVNRVEERGERVYVMELTIETLIDQLTRQSEDPIQLDEVAQQWVDLLYELLGKDSFVLHIEKFQYVIIHSTADSMVKNFLLSGIVRFASDVFGVDAEEQWFDASFYEMTPSAMEQFSTWIQ